jgi:hypothetical protein
MRKFIINFILSAFVFLDFLYAVTAFFFPEVWFKFIHNAQYVDPQGLLQRTAAVWAAFTLFHLIALLKWKKQPYWLAVVAGVRFSELFADWTYLYFAEDISFFGWVGLIISTPTNFFVSLFLLKSYLKISKQK